MNIILLSGGTGKRLWPLSNDVRSKQFLKIFKDEDGNYESMLQRMYRKIKNIDNDANIVIATAKNQVSSTKNQLGDSIDISIEPCRKNTFPAIVLATAYLSDIKGIDKNESVVVCPVDPFVDDNYFLALKKLSKLKSENDDNLYLMGINPTCPSEKYGYIIPENGEKVSKVKMFKEKPDEKTAVNYIKQGALWNGGVFAYDIGYLLGVAHNLIDFEDYYDLYDKYETLEKISFDYAFVEKEKSISVLRFDGKWEDLGTWDTLSESLDDNIIGNATLDNTSNNSNIINELNIPILGIGLNNIVVAASPDGILVTDKSLSDNIKGYVEEIEGQVMFAEKSWGSYRIINIEKESQTLLVMLNQGHSMKYHSHDNRNEVWNIISGEGKTIIDGMEQNVKPGDVITIDAGCKHTIIANTALKIIEVQIGKEISVGDKHVFELE